MADNRGGERTGQTGQAYSNRTDLAFSGDSGDTAGHLAGGQAGTRGSGTSTTELREQSAAAPTQAGSPAPVQAAPVAPGNLTPLDAPGGGGQLIDNAGRQPIFPPDPDGVIRQLYNMTGHPDLLDLLERRGR